MKKKKRHENKIIKWIDTYNAICNGITPHCPKCNSSDIKHEFYAGDDKLGYGVITCNTCGNYVHLCRIKFPDNVETVPFNFNK